MQSAKFVKRVFEISFVLPVLLLLISTKSFAQQDSCHLQISLLTVMPGEELYSTFGHSALRVTDTVTHRDIVYNYGTFNFDDPDFYTKFVRGKLLYYLSTDDFHSFVSENQQDNRGITEQILNLSCEQKRNIIGLLEANMMAQNRFYKYDFLFDNCTTRIRDLVQNASDSSVHFGKALHTQVSFRNLIHEYLNYNDKQWSKLGIDILLGSKTDAIASPYQVMFLPDYLMKTLDSSNINSQPLVVEKHSLFKINYSQNEKNNLSHPFFIFICLFVLIAFLSFSKNTFIQKFLASFDALLFFIVGLLGILILFMWFGTDHIMCRNNYNLLWAWPMNIVAAFYMHSKRKWPRVYFFVYAVFNMIVIAVWGMIPQHLNFALIPILAILIFRSLLYFIRKK
ncbi:MAG: lipoprotein N-acyltransferase Lnb domain-containing protein [Ginsengibacter sp.]